MHAKEATLLHHPDPRHLDNRRLQVVRAKPLRQSRRPGSSGTDASSHSRGSSPGTPYESEHANMDPPRPAFFRSPRESFLPQPRRQDSTAPSSPNVDPTPPLRDSDTESSASSLIHRAGTLLASLTMFPSSHSAPKSVPRPLMPNSRGLITTKSPQLHSHSSARSEDGTPEPRGGPGQWGDVLLAIKNRHALKQESISSTSSSAYPLSGAYARSAGTGPRSDHESDGSTAASRRVPLNRKSVSPMALASRSPHLPWNVPLPGVGRSSGHPLSNGSVTAEDMETASERGWRHFKEQVHIRGGSVRRVGRRVGNGGTCDLVSRTDDGQRELYWQQGSWP